MFVCLCEVRWRLHVRQPARLRRRPPVLRRRRVHSDQRRVRGAGRAVRAERSASADRRGGRGARALVPQSHTQHAAVGGQERALSAHTRQLLARCERGRLGLGGDGGATLDAVHSAHRVEVPLGHGGDRHGPGMLALGLPAAQQAGRLLLAAEWRHRQLQHRLHCLLNVLAHPHAGG